MLLEFSNLLLADRHSSSVAEPGADGRGRWSAAWLPWLLCAVTIAITAAAAAFLIANHATPRAPGFGFPGFAALFAIAFATIGALVASRRPDNAIGWIFCGGGLESAIQVIANEYGTYALLTRPGALPGGEFMAWLPAWIWLPTVGILTVFLFLLFPNGRLLAPRWRGVIWASVAAMVTAGIGFAFMPGPVENFRSLRNPFGIDGFGTVLTVMTSVGLFTLAVCIAISVGSLIIRFVGAKGDEREQIKWFLAAAALVSLALIASFVETVITGTTKYTDKLVIFSLLGVPIATGFAILKYRLYDIDVVINRTLVYAPLSAMLAGLYAASITLSQRVFIAVTGQRSDAAIVFTTLVVAATFTPVKARLQTSVDRVFKESAQPSARLRPFREQVRSFVQVMDARQVCRGMLEQVGSAFGAESGAVYLRSDHDLDPVCVHAYGETEGVVGLSISLEHNGVQIGEVRLGPRRDGRNYDERDARAVRDLAGIVAQAIVLAGRPVLPEHNSLS